MEDPNHRIYIHINLSSTPGSANQLPENGQIDSCLVICSVVLGSVRGAILRVIAETESLPSEFGPRNVRGGVDRCLPGVELGRSVMSRVFHTDSVYSFRLIIALYIIQSNTAVSSISEYLPT